jgi:hypothetical protein
MKETSSAKMKTQSRQSYLRRGGRMLQSWRRDVTAALSLDADDCCAPRDRLTALTPPSPGGETSSAVPDEARAELSQSSEQPPKRSVLLPSPIPGKALLVKLAPVLPNHVADPQPNRDPLLLTILRCPPLCLSVDRAVNVEFRDESSAYPIAVDISLSRRVSVEAADFEAPVEFIAQYVATQVGEHLALAVSS